MAESGARKVVKPVAATVGDAGDDRQHLVVRTQAPPQGQGRRRDHDHDEQEVGPRPSTSAGRHSLMEPCTTHVGQGVHVGGSAVDDDGHGAVPDGDRHQPGGREDRQGRAHGQQQVARRRRLLGPEEVLGHQALAEADGGRLEDAAADDAAVPVADHRRTGRVGLAGPHPVVHRLGRLAVAATQAHHLERRAVDLDDAIGVAARLLVQPVDVLRHQQVQPPAALQVDQGAVTGVRRRRPQR